LKFYQIAFIVYSVNCLEFDLTKCFCDTRDKCDVQKIFLTLFLVISQRRGSIVNEVTVTAPRRRNSRGMALLSSSDQGSVFKDILFLLTCCMSVCLTSAVPINVYESGMSFAVMR